jgi:thiamine pyrophosphokinase
LLGIVFSGGESPPTEIIKKAVGKKCAFVVAADSGLDAAEKCGIEPDCIIGDMDSVEISRLDAYPPERVIRYDCDKDYTDTELALEKVFEKGCDEVWIIGGGGGRYDHLFAVRSLFEREVFPTRWITENNDIRCIDAKSDKNEFSTNLERGCQVSVFPIGEGSWEAKSKGLKWPLDNLCWNRGFFSISNIVTDGSFSVTAVKGRFLIIGKIVNLPLE